MKQSAPLVKILALVTSIALAAGYVAYRVANAKSDGKAAPRATDGAAGAPPAPPPEPGIGSVPMMGGSKSLAPLLESEDLEPAPKEPAPPAPEPKAPK